MKKSITNIVAGALLTTSIGMSGCFGGADPTVKSAVINSNNVIEYKVYDSFDINNYVLDVTMSDGATKTINITSDMIKELPDMNSSGTKTFKVTYEGKDYTYTINVGGYSNTEMLAKLEAFMEDYNHANPGSVKVNILANYFARFLEYTSSGELPEDMLAMMINKNDMGGVEILEQIYSSLVGGIASSSSNIDVDNIVDSNNLKSQTDFIKLLQGIVSHISDFNYPKYILDTFMHSSDYATFVEVMVEAISQGFGMDSQNAKNELKSLINMNLRDYIDYVSNLSTETPGTFDMYDAIADFNEIVQKYAGGYIKLTCQTIMDTIDDGDPHMLSNFVQGLVNANLSIFPLGNIQAIDDGDPYTYDSMVWVKVDNAETQAIDRKMSLFLSDAIFSFEEIVVNYATKGSADVDQLMTNLATAIDGLVACQGDLYDAGYTCPVMDGLWMPLSVLSLGITNYQNSESYVDFAVSMAKNLMIPEILGQYFADLLISGPDDFEGVSPADEYEDLEDVATQMQQNMANIITNLIHDALNAARGEGFVPSADDYLNDICTLLDITDTQKIIAYTTEWNNTGFCSVISDYLEEMIISNSESDTITMVSDLIDIIKYFENCIRTSGEKKEEFSLLEAVNKLYILADDSCEYYEDYLAEIEQMIEDTENSEPEINDDEYGSLTNLNYMKTMIQNDLEIWKIVRTLTDFTEETNTIKGNIDNLIAQYKKDIVDGLTKSFVSFLGIQEFTVEESPQNPGIYEFEENLEYVFAMQESELVFDYHVRKYLEGKLDYQSLLADMSRLINTYAIDEVKVLANSTAFATLITMGKDANSEIDFNEIFGFIDLPAEIASVDYNKLVETFWSENTYKEMFKVSKVDVKYETDTQGNIAKELLEVTFSIDYDLKITTLQAEMTLNMEIQF